ncbi:MAG: serine protease [Bacteroidetes bacterium]|nr:serine protease [Bacteroidota bacterium]
MTSNYSGANSDRICSPFILNEFRGESCFKVKIIPNSLVSHDLALLELEEAVSEHIEPILLAIDYNGPRSSYKIFGYSERNESERAFSVVDAAIASHSSVDALVGNVPLVDIDLYHIDAPQYPGASGAPLIDPAGYAAATVVRGIDSNQQAYGIPHYSSDFVNWLLENTKFSEAGEKLLQQLLQNKDTDVLKNELACILDVRRPSFSSLDLMHIGRTLSKKKSSLFKDLAMYPLSSATNSQIDWSVIAQSQLSPLETALMLEVKKEISWQNASRTKDNAEKYYWYSRTERNATSASSELAKLLDSSQDTPAVVASLGRAYLKSYFQEHNSQIRLDEKGISLIKKRIYQNTEDATKASIEAYKISGNRDDLHKAILASAYGIGQISTVNNIAVNYAQFNEIYNNVKVPNELSENFSDFKAHIPKRYQELSQEQLEALAEISVSFAAAPVKTDGIM